MVSVAKGSQIFQNFRGFLTVLGARRVKWSKFHIQYPCVLGDTPQNVVAPDLCIPDLYSVISFAVKRAVS